MVSRKAKLRTEAPVNGGRNYNGPKVSNASLSKTEPYAGNSSTAFRYFLILKKLKVKIRKTRGQSAGKAWNAPGTLRDFTFRIDQRDFDSFVLMHYQKEIN